MKWITKCYNSQFTIPERLIIQSELFSKSKLIGFSYNFLFFLHLLTEDAYCVIDWTLFHVGSSLNIKLQTLTSSPISYRTGQDLTAQFDD
jgi:hypothetical protein